MFSLFVIDGPCVASRSSERLAVRENRELPFTYLFVLFRDYSIDKCYHSLSVAFLAPLSVCSSDLTSRLYTYHVRGNAQHPPPFSALPRAPIRRTIADAAGAGAGQPRGGGGGRRPREPTGEPEINNYLINSNI